jgi:hypothetical protein
MVMSALLPTSKGMNRFVWLAGLFESLSLQAASAIDSINKGK